MNDEFLQQYNEDYLLEHTYLKNIYYYDEDDKKYYKANLELFGHSLNIKVYENGEIIKEVKSVSTKTSEMEHEIISKKENEIIVKDGSNVFVLNTEQYSIFNNYYDCLNEEFNIQRIVFKDDIDKLSQDLLKDNNIMTMLDNYFSDIAPNYFMNYELIAGFELKLIQSNKIGKLLLLSEDDLRKAMLIVREEKSKNKTRVFESIKNEDLIQPYFENNFQMLTKVLKNRLEINYIISMYLTYEILVKYAIKYYSKIWHQNYGQYFVHIENLKLIDAVSIYCNIESINPQNLLTAGHFIYYLIDNNKFENDNYLICYDVMVDLIRDEMDNKRLNNFEKKLTTNKSEVIYSISDIDLMNGQEFESFIALMFLKMGYKTTITKGSGDQGIDVIAEKNNLKIGIQAKCYSGSVSNSAIQEVAAGIKHYNLDKAMVVTNNYFTQSAQELANSNNVVLWDRNMLKEKLLEVEFN